MMFETQATTNYPRYYSGGLRRAKWLFDIAAEVLPDDPLRVCEWGMRASASDSAHALVFIFRRDWGLWHRLQRKHYRMVSRAHTQRPF
jgi:hypothetical protein